MLPPSATRRNFPAVRARLDAAIEAGRRERSRWEQAQRCVGGKRPDRGSKVSPGCRQVDREVAEAVARDHSALRELGRAIRDSWNEQRRRRRDTEPAFWDATRGAWLIGVASPHVTTRVRGEHATRRASRIRIRI